MNYKTKYWLLAMVLCWAGVARAGGCYTCQRAATVTYQTPYIQYYPVNYGVAPWVQAQAVDTYNFRGSQERLELERLRGYVAGRQEADRQQQLTTGAVVGEDEPPTEQGGGGETPPATATNQPPTMPMVQMYCASCHNHDTQSGGLWIDADAPWDTEEFDIVRGKMQRMLQAGKMPIDANHVAHPLPQQTIDAILREVAGTPPAAAQTPAGTPPAAPNGPPPPARPRPPAGQWQGPQAAPQPAPAAQWGQPVGNATPPTARAVAWVRERRATQPH